MQRECCGLNKEDHKAQNCDAKVETCLDAIVELTVSMSRNAAIIFGIVVAVMVRTVKLYLCPDKVRVKVDCITLHTPGFFTSLPLPYG